MAERLADLPVPPHRQAGRALEALARAIAPATTSLVMGDPPVPRPGAILPSGKMRPDEPDTRVLSALGEGAEALSNFVGPGAGAKGLGVAAATAAAGARPIRAYHSGRHLFDKFDLSKIGTGEGAQVFGHGLYVAEAPGASHYYRTAGAPLKTPVKEETIASKYYLDAKGDRDKALADLSSDFTRIFGTEEEKALVQKMLSSGEVPKLYKEYAGNMKPWEKAQELLREGWKPPGHTYEVAVHASPDEFLRREYPLSVQPEPVHAAIKRIGHEKFLPDPKDPEIPAYLRRDPGAKVDLLGSDLYNTLATQGGARVFGQPIFGRDPARASRQLNEAGVKGISYLDQWSRGHPGMSEVDQTIGSVLDAVGGNRERALAILKGRLESSRDLPAKYQAPGNLEKAVGALEGGWKDPRTLNYVIFDPSIMEITRRYAAPGAIGAGAAAEASRGGRE